MKIKRATGSAVLIATFGCLAVNAGVGLPVSEVRAEDVAIFALLISQSLPAGRGPLVLQRQTLTGSYLFRMLRPPYSRGEGTPDLPASVVTDWKRRNRRPVSLPSFQADRPLLFVDGAKLDRIFKWGFWNAFYKRYPNTAGTGGFSLPGYSSDGQTALVYFQHESGGRSGSGFVYHLIRRGGQWSTKRILGGWRS